MDAVQLRRFCSTERERVAIVLVDFQNDFCAGPNGTANAATARRANEFARTAGELGVRTIYTQEVLDESRLDQRQRRVVDDPPLCRAGTPGTELFIEPVPGARVVHKSRFDIWRSTQFTDALEELGIDALVIGGVELQCCVLYAVMGAMERGYPYVVPQDLVSGFDTRDNTTNPLVRDLLRTAHPSVESSDELLNEWASAPASAPGTGEPATG